LQAGAACFHGRLHLRLLVGREVVENDDIARLERGREDLFDIGDKRRIIHRPIEDRRCHETMQAQGGDDRVGLPVTARRVIAQSRPAWTPPVATQQIGGHAALVEKEVLTDVAERLHARPLPAGRGDVRSALFVCVYGFF